MSLMHRTGSRNELLEMLARSCVTGRNQGQNWADELDLISPERTVPVMWHVDGYKVYRRKKAWAWSWSSATIKTGILKTKIVLTAVYLNRFNTV